MRRTKPVYKIRPAHVLAQDTVISHVRLTSLSELKRPFVPRVVTSAGAKGADAPDTPAHLMAKVHSTSALQCHIALAVSLPMLISPPAAPFLEPSVS